MCDWSFESVENFSIFQISDIDYFLFFENRHIMSKTIGNLLQPVLVH